MKALVLLSMLLAPVFAFPAPIEFNGHFYDIVDTPLTWDQARTMAEQMSWSNLPGHLVTITSPAEDYFLCSSFSSPEPFWIGAYQTGPEDWEWVTGEEWIPPYWAPLILNNPGLNCMTYSPATDPDCPWEDRTPIINYGFLIEYEADLSVAPDFNKNPVLGFRAQPNPFNPRTEIRFELSQATRVTLQIFDVRGRALRTLTNSHLQVGSHIFVWDGLSNAGHRASSGLYYCRLTFPGENLIIKLVLLK